MSTSRTIQNDLYNANQSWYLERIVEVAVAGVDHRFRVRIRRNAYDDQSSAVCERWDGSAWQQIVSRPITAMEVGARRPAQGNPTNMVPVVSYARKDVDEKLFDKDARSLIDMALKVVAA